MVQPTSNDATVFDLPVIDVDPYSTEVLTDPYPFHHKLLEADPPEHTVVRSIIERVLYPRAVKVLRDKFEAEAGALVDRLISGGSFDAVTGFAEVFLVRVFSDAVGVREEGRENLLLYGDMVFNGQGPRNELFKASTKNLAKAVARIEGEVLLGARARKVGRIELDGEPQRHFNNTVRSFASLPVTFHDP